VEGVTPRRQDEVGRCGYRDGDGFLGRGWEAGRDFVAAVVVGVELVGFEEEVLEGLPFVEGCLFETDVYGID
jgi:hypothetical protein